MFFNKFDPPLLTGDSFSIGIQHGKLFKKEVHRSIETYEEMFWEYSELKWRDAIERAKMHLDAIERFDKTYLYELEGIANGANLDFEDILALNCRSELTLVNNTDGCTSFYVKDSHSNTHWLLQNWDWKSSQKNSIIIVSIKRKDKPKFTMLTEAGIIGKIGLNTEGVGVCLNALRTNAWESKVPIHFGLRRILESNSLKEAIDRVKGSMASAANFLVVDSKSGSGANLEVSPKYTEVIKTKNNFLTHTNHICSLRLLNKVNEDALKDSYIRNEIGVEKIKQLSEKTISIKYLYQLLCDHNNFPYSICRHESVEDKPFERMETVFSVIMNLCERKMYWSMGKPCQVISGFSTKL